MRKFSSIVLALLASQVTFASELTLNLNSGWNLVGSNIDASIEKNDAIKSIWAYESNGWSINPTTIKAGSGLWIKSFSKNDLILSGDEVSNFTIPISKGWNLVSPLKDITAEKLLNDSNIISIWKYKNGWLKNSDISTINIGEGFWINAKDVTEVSFSDSSDIVLNLESKSNYEDKSYLKCYGIYMDDFINRSDLVKASWGLDENGDYVEIGGNWKDSSFFATKENYFKITHINGVEVSESEIAPMLKEACVRGMNKEEYDEGYSKVIRYYASDSNAGNDYPLLKPSEVNSIDNDFTNALDYTEILRYAYAANYAYTIEEGADEFKYNKDNDRFVNDLFFIDGKVKELDKMVEDKANDIYVHAVALELPAVEEKGLEKEIVIAYKGTEFTNTADLASDIRLSLTNLYESNRLTKWHNDAYDFYKRVTEKYPPCKASYDEEFQDGKPESGCYNVTITGHSLGAYLATDIGIRSGIATRVFSSPGTRVVESYITIFANQMKLNNVINFYRKGDPVVNMSGGHVENMIEFPAPTDTLDPAGSHYLSPFIDDIIKMNYASVVGDKTPLNVEVKPDVMVGRGLNKVLNIWDKPSFENSKDPKKYPLTSENDLTENKIDEIFTYFDENGEKGNFKGVDDKTIQYVKFEKENEDAALVIVSGRTETYLKYAEFVYDILKTNNLNYSIYLLDHRSQGFSDRLTVEDPAECYGDKASENKEECHKHHLNNFDDMVVDLHTFVTDIVKPENHENLLVYGHSMGGGLTTRYIETHPDVFKAAFLSAPMHEIAGVNNLDITLLNTGLFKSKEEKKVEWLYLGTIQKSKPWDEPITEEEKNKAFASDHTTSRNRWDMVLNMWKENPQVQLGGVTYGWLNTAFEATDNMLNDVENISIPVKIVQASEDSAVGADGQNKICSSIFKNGGECELVINRGSKHEGMVETDQYRGFFMTEFFDFMNKYSSN